MKFPIAVSQRKEFYSLCFRKVHQQKTEKEIG